MAVKAVKDKKKSLHAQNYASTKNGEKFLHATSFTCAAEGTACHKMTLSPHWASFKPCCQ